MYTCMLYAAETSCGKEVVVKSTNTCVGRKWLSSQRVCRQLWRCCQCVLLCCIHHLHNTTTSHMTCHSSHLTFAPVYMNMYHEEGSCELYTSKCHFSALAVSSDLVKWSYHGHLTLPVGQLLLCTVISTPHHNIGPGAMVCL